MCKAHSKVTHIKQQIYFHRLKGRGYNKNSVNGYRYGYSYYTSFQMVPFSMT